MPKPLQHLFVLLVICFPITVLAQWDNDEFLRVEQAFQPQFERTETQLFITWSAEPSYYLYQRQFRYQLDSKLLKIQYHTEPLVKYDEEFEETVSVFYRQVRTSVVIPQHHSSVLELHFQGCTDKGLCYIPTTWHYQLQDNSAKKISVEQAEKAQTSSPFSWIQLLIMVAFALVGGLVLNLMPCVFPVLSIKAISFIESEKPKVMGWQYSAGVICSMLVLAAVVLALRALGNSTGWGFQLQYPAVILTLFMLFFGMACNLLGFFELGHRLASLGGSKQWGSFGTGVLAVVVASPCTAPFMASAIGYAFTQSTVVALAVFIFLGIGLALPILLLSYYPQLAQKLPKSGVWLHHFKQWMALPLLITCIWLLWILYYQLGINAVLLVVLACILFLFAALLRRQNYRKASLLFLLLSLSCFIATPNLAKQRDEATTEQSFTMQQYQQWLVEEPAFFINVTAKWCITCKVNERTVFSREYFKSVLADLDARYIELDMTSPNLELEKLLQSYKHPGVPLYLWKTQGSEAIAVLPQILTKSTTLFYLMQ